MWRNAAFKKRNNDYLAARTPFGLHGYQASETGKGGARSTACKNSQQELNHAKEQGLKNKLWEVVKL